MGDYVVSRLSTVRCCVFSSYRPVWRRAHHEERERMLVVPRRPSLLRILRIPSRPRGEGWFMRRAVPIFWDGAFSAGIWSIMAQHGMAVPCSGTRWGILNDNNGDAVAIIPAFRPPCHVRCHLIVQLCVWLTSVYPVFNMYSNPTMGLCRDPAHITNWARCTTLRSDANLAGVDTVVSVG